MSAFLRGFVLVLGLLLAFQDAEAADGRHRIVPRLKFSTEAPDLTLDLYLPKGQEQPMPCILVIQGGGFLPQDGSRFRSFAAFLADHGFAAALLSYRGRPDFHYQDTVGDVKVAARFVRSVAKEHGIDPDRLGAMGRSAGGTLAALLATTGGESDLEGQGGHAGFSSRIQAGVALAGVFDFIGRFTDPEQIRLMPNAVSKKQTNGEWIGPAFSPEDPDWIRASAIRHVDAQDPPMLLLHCRDDRTVPWIQSRDFHQALVKAGVTAEVTFYEKGGHGFQGLGDTPMEDMVRFFRKTLTQAP